MRLHTKYTSCNATDARGFTLVEVLVSLVVLSIGLLGMAKMVMVSSHSNENSRSLSRQGHLKIARYHHPDWKRIPEARLKERSIRSTKRASRKAFATGG